MIGPLALALALVASDPTAPDPSAARRPVLVELFTSEGCSSCPPAEAVLARLLAEQPVPGARILLLARHVTYWDRLGWKDPFGSAAATARQESCVERLGGGSLYTPQAVVNGEAEVVGSNRAALVRAVEEAARRTEGSLVLRAVGADRLALEARWERGVAGEVWVAAVTPRAESEVGAGENAGRRLVHLSIARHQWKLGEGLGEARLEVPRPRAPLDAPLLVAWVQQPGCGRVLAVGEISP